MTGVSWEISFTMMHPMDFNIPYKTGIYRGHIGIMEKRMQTTILGLGLRVPLK